MAVKMSGKYLGNKKLELCHEPSGVKITTAAPLDNQGDGSSFSPTDLCAVSLAACMTTVMAIFAERSSIDLSGTSFEITKEMNASPRRIGKIELKISLPKALDSETRLKLERAAKTCPVSHSLSSEIEPDIQFIYV